MINILQNLPVDLLELVIFWLGSEGRSVVSLATTSKYFHQLIFANLNNNNNDYSYNNFPTGSTPIQQQTSSFSPRVWKNVCGCSLGCNIRFWKSFVVKTTDPNNINSNDNNHKRESGKGECNRDEGVDWLKLWKVYKAKRDEVTVVLKLLHQFWLLSHWNCLVSNCIIYIQCISSILPNWAALGSS